MKEKWVFPQTQVQQFMANEYVAACENSSGTTYKFVCDGTRYMQLLEGASVYLDDGSFKGFYYGQCGETEEITVPQGTDMSNVFESGYICSILDGLQILRTPVIIWTDNRGRLHCTRELNVESWEIVRS